MQRITDQDTPSPEMACQSTQDDAPRTEPRATLTEPLLVLFFAELLLCGFVANLLPFDPTRATWEIAGLFLLFGAGGIFALSFAIHGFVRWFRSRR